MNDSCEGRIRRTQLRANQVFSVETPTTILHNALAFFRPVDAYGYFKSIEINEKGGGEEAVGGTAT